MDWLHSPPSTSSARMAGLVWPVLEGKSIWSGWGAAAGGMARDQGLGRMPQSSDDMEKKHVRFSWFALSLDCGSSPTAVWNVLAGTCQVTIAALRKAPNTVMPDSIRHPVATQAIGKQGVFASVVTGCRIESGMTWRSAIRCSKMGVSFGGNRKRIRSFMALQALPKLIPDSSGSSPE
jgi:hypothetical protein